jgi:dienelactone hydrolase
MDMDEREGFERAGSTGAAAMTAGAGRRCLLGGALCALVALAPLGAAGEMLRLPFTLSKPAGDGPFPAVVILHDCSGLGPRSSGAPWRWTSELTSRGYVAIWPDSFGSRGRPQGVCTDASPPGIPPELRAGDAYAALAHLQSLPFVDARRIAVMGGSHGGSSTLATIVDTPENVARAGSGFAAAIALYPGCARKFGGWSVEGAKGAGRPIVGYSGTFKPLAPLLILTGELDDWTPAEPCRKLAEAARAAGHPVEIKVYPGAHHAFDSPAPVRYVAERVNLNAATGRGATTGGDASAWADAIGQVERFLAQHVRK